jgi:hypothetical protein
MNFSHLVLYFLCNIHVIIWIVVILAGIINKTANYFNLLILLPLIYIIQILLYTHPIITSKILYIKNHLNDFSDVIDTSITFSDYELLEITHFSTIHNLPYQNVLEYFQILRHFEKKGLMTLFFNFKNSFNNSYKNPFTAQGLLVLGYIINVYLLVFRDHFK